MMAQPMKSLEFLPFKFLWSNVNVASEMTWPHIYILMQKKNKNKNKQGGDRERKSGKLVKYYKYMINIFYI